MKLSVNNVHLNTNARTKVPFMLNISLLIQEILLSKSDSIGEFANLEQSVRYLGVQIPSKFKNL
jgi:hypothetical protein